MDERRREEMWQQMPSAYTPTSEPLRHTGLVRPGTYLFSIAHTQLGRLLVFSRFMFWVSRDECIFP